jgi:hypothetical protein
VVSQPVFLAPLSGLLPVQSPAALQVVAFVVDQLISVRLPLVIVLGVAVTVTVGAATGGLDTATVASLVALPPGPVQVSAKTSLEVSQPVFLAPLSGLLPVQSPAAVQAVAFVADQLINVRLPLVIVLGVAVTVTLGAGAVPPTTATVT